MFVKIGQATDAGSGTTVAKNCRETTEQSIDIDILGVDDVETKFNEISKVGNIVNTKNLGIGNISCLLVLLLGFTCFV